MYSLPSLPLYSASSWSFVSVLNFWTQNCQKSQILRLLKVSQLKHRFQPRYAVMVIMVKYIPRFHFVYKLKCFQGFLRWKKKMYKEFWYKIWLKFLMISLFLFITGTRFDSEPICYFCARSLCATCAHEHFKLCTVIFYPVMNIS